MKFSVLIPTRNRLDNLKSAIYSVLIQNYDDFEIVISDNDSEENIQEYVASLNNPRIRYSRTEAFISVTENWNRTVDQSRGEYVIMLGDDDCLAKGYFFLMDKLIVQHSSPDLIYSDAFLYAYPGILKGYPNGYLRTSGNCSFWKKSSPFYLNREEAHEFAKKTMSFKFGFSFNMQYGTVRRSLIDKLRFQGVFFHSPYPDYYAMTLLLKKADRILICPYPMTIIGISPKSFGCFYFNDKEDVGMELLNNKADCNLHPELEHVILSGSMMNTCWLYALTSLQKNYFLLNDFKINYSQYRRLQIVKYLKLIKNKSDRISLFLRFATALRWWEIVSYMVEIPLVYLFRKVFGANFLKKFQNRFLLQNPLSHNEYSQSYNSVLDVVNGLNPIESNGYITNKEQ